MCFVKWKKVIECNKQEEVIQGAHSNVETWASLHWFLFLQVPQTGFWEFYESVSNWIGGTLINLPQKNWGMSKGGTFESVPNSQ
jgi:hypothetical protein